MLFKRRETVPAQVVMVALREAAGPYKDLLDFYHECIAIHKHHSEKKENKDIAKQKFKPIKGMEKFISVCG